KVLPAWMVPGQIVAIDPMPLTRAGKVDRQKLAGLEISLEVNRAAFQPPQTGVQAGLAELFAQVLKVERVGLQDDFFALGGHSLLATQLNSRIRHTFGVDLPLTDQFEYPRLGELAEQIELALRSSRGMNPTPIFPADHGPDLPLSYAQSRIWFLTQLAPESTAYNIPLAVRLVGKLDTARFKTALEQLVARHAVLRSRFETHNGMPVRRVDPDYSFVLSLEDLDHRSEPEKQRMIDQIIAAESSTPFDLFKGPMVRMRLLAVKPDEHILMVVVHHIAADGWSLGVLIRELGALYRGETLPALPIEYADYAAWQTEQLNGGQLEQEWLYWRENLSGGLPVLELPYDHPRPVMVGSRGGVVPVQVSPDLRKRLEDCCRKEGVTLYML
ncbi:non-ribosomal peptide synthetase, partial [bacterium]|nr:non-ribosomal peptide synthetase [bacterium]